MSEEARSMLLAPGLLFVLFAVAVVIAAARPPRRADAALRARLVEAFLIGIAFQCAHMVEEFVTGLHQLYPPLIGLAPLTAEFFVGFNVFWLGVWSLSAVGALRGWPIAYVPIWFFGLAMCLNGIVHPLLALWVGGYFPGLVTAPLVGVVGVVVTARLVDATEGAEPARGARPA